MKKLSYLSHIDSLRAIAVLLVILFHLDFNFFEGGFIGVDVFFVISGFLITRILIHEYDTTGTVSFKNFYVRRIRRLMPTLFLTIYLAFMVTFLLFSPSDFINAAQSMFMSAVAISNFHFLGESSYFDVSSNFKPLLHTWSLGIEEQFYLIYPVMLFLLLKMIKRKKAIVVVLFSLFLASLLLNIYTTQYGISTSLLNLFLPEDNLASGVASFQFYLLPFRMFEFLLGAIVGLIPAPKLKSEPIKLLLTLLSLGTIISFAIIFNKNTQYLSTWNLVPCLGIGLLLWAPPSKSMSFLFENKFFKYIGKISYTLYLIHWLVIVGYRYLFDGDLLFIEQVSLFIIMFLLSSIIYKYYETPFRYTNSKYSIKSTSVLILFLVINILVIYLIKVKSNCENGWLWRLGNNNLELIEKIGVPKDFHKTHWGGADYKAGWLGEKKQVDVEPDMLWFGDSHATHYKYGLDHVMVKKNNLHIYFTFLISSLRLPDVINPSRGVEDSENRFNGDLALINKYPNSIVVLSHSWLGQIKLSEVFNQSINSYERFNRDSTGWKLTAQKIEKYHRLIGQNRTIIIMGETPAIEVNELNYVEKLTRPKYLSNLAPTTSTFPHNSIAFNTFFKNYFQFSKNIIFIDPSDAYCTDGICLKQMNDKIYYSDNNHLTKDGSLEVIKYLEQDFIDILKVNRKDR
jgi:peptidoglycan/LPS O-acetylase OafA/YrhL